MRGDLAVLPTGPCLLAFVSTAASSELLMSESPPGLRGSRNRIDGMIGLMAGACGRDLGRGADVEMMVGVSTPCASAVNLSELGEELLRSVMPGSTDELL